MEFHGALWLTAVMVCINVVAPDEVSQLQDTLVTLAKQVMIQQFYVEEQTRSHGDSGIKHIRLANVGTRSYHSESHTGRSFSAIHDHANNIRTIGMGEINAVLNGVEFRTRHNDYRMRMKHRTSTKYGDVEDFPFPGVPPAVTQRTSIDGQIKEMREWFKAWKDQDFSIRDYRDYFKPVLCYLEGSWTHASENTIDEPFGSDRHNIDAKNYQELIDKIRFSSYAGVKDGLENLAYLPTTIINMANGTFPVLAQWNYGILCHPLSVDVPLNRLYLVDDLKTRMANGGVPLSAYKASRAGRFRVSIFDSDMRREGSSKNSLLDSYMSEIPGMDGYAGNITEEVFGEKTYPYDRSSKDPLNAAMYNRVYRVASRGAMGTKIRNRGYSDRNLYVARTTQAKVAKLELTTCTKKKKRGKDCEKETSEGRWSYAIPLEIIYMTPLSEWNPHHLPYRGEANTPEGRTVFGEGRTRNGGNSTAEAYNGTNSKAFYRTPLDFFGDDALSDPADTTKKSTCVLDRDGKVTCVKATGHRIFLPNIPGVGALRQRYPIAPVHEEGSAAWKELDALKELVLNSKRYKDVFEDPDEDGPTSPPKDPKGCKFVMTAPNKNPHQHTVYLDEYQCATLQETGVVENVSSEEASSHSHVISIKKTRLRGYRITLCDGRNRCRDKHPPTLQTL